jgi:uncharacterized protein YndB with AHSA1/START domain
MATETVLVSEVIFTTRERLYEAWLDSKEHSAFTAEAADIEPVVGGTHSAFSGYATGQLLTLEPHRRIIQTWRTTEFPAGAPDSRLELTFEDTLGGTLITLLHTGIPSGQSDQCRDGWLKYYFAPMKSYFDRETAPDATPDIEPGALSPAPARNINRPASKTKANATAKKPQKAKAKAKARPAAAKKAKARRAPAAKAKSRRASAPKKRPVAKKKPAAKKKVTAAAKRPAKKVAKKKAGKRR